MIFKVGVCDIRMADARFGTPVQKSVMILMLFLLSLQIMNLIRLLLRLLKKLVILHLHQIYLKLKVDLFLV